MEENTKIKLNLSGLQKKISETYEAEDTWLDTKNESPVSSIGRVKLKLTQDISPPRKVSEIIKEDTTTDQEKKRESLKQEKSDPSERKSWEKLSFAAITWITQEQEKANAKNTREKENARAQTQRETEKKNQEERRIEKKEEIKFTNYRSKFKNESDNIIQKIQKFRYAPKTRVWFLVTLVVFTTFSIWLLMVLFPEKHSPEIYKASLLEIYNSERKNHNEVESIQDIWDQREDSAWEENISESKEEAENIILEEEREISEVEKEMRRVRNHLLEKYK